MQSILARYLTAKGRRHLKIKKEVIAWMQTRPFGWFKSRWIHISVPPGTCQLVARFGDLGSQGLYIDVSYDIGTPVIMTLVFYENNHLRTDWK